MGEKSLKADEWRGITRGHGGNALPLMSVIPMCPENKFENLDFQS